MLLVRVELPFHGEPLSSASCGLGWPPAPPGTHALAHVHSPARPCLTELSSAQSRERVQGRGLAAPPCPLDSLRPGRLHEETEAQSVMSEVTQMATRRLWATLGLESALT